MATAALSGIYEIVNLANGKRYVGSAINFTTRWLCHRGQLRRGEHHSRHLQRSWNKHGESNFVFRPLFVCQKAHLIFYEQIALTGLRPEYNVSKTAGSTLGVRFTAEGRARISASLKGKRKGVPRTRESVEKTAAAHRGMKRSDETRQKIADKARCRPFVRHNDDYRVKLSAALKGKTKSPEHMAALQAGRARRIYTPEQREKIAVKLREQYDNGTRSRHRSQEYRDKIAATLSERMSTPENRERLRQQALAAAARRRVSGD